MQPHGVFTVCGIQLYDNPVGEAADGRSDTAGGGQVDFTVGCHFAGFDDGDIYFSHKAVAHFLRHLRQMDVVVGNLAVVYRFTEIGIGCVRSTVADSFDA